MIDAIRPFVLGLAMAGLPLAVAVCRGDDDPPKPAAGAGAGIDALRDDLAPFVPLKPRTAEDQSRIEALRQYTAARALEDQRRFREAVQLFDKALKKEPESLAILRRLSRISFAQGRIAQGVEYSKRIVKTDPNDAATVRQLVAHFQFMKDAPGLETMLKGVLDNPKLDKASSAYMLVENDLGDLYAGQLQRFDKAAEAYEKVMEGLDDKAANRISPADLKRILGADETLAYLKFGEIFYRARKYDLAIKAFRRGLVYDPTHAQIPILLIQTQLKAGKPADALAVLEPILKRRPPGAELYELLARILTALKRKSEIVARFEEAVKADPENIALKYALADRYREDGKAAEADALYKAILARQPDPKGFSAQSEALRKAKKYDELLKLFEKAQSEPGRRPGGAGPEGVQAQIESIATDPAVADDVLDAGMKMLEADPAELGDAGRNVLVQIANSAKKPAKLIALERLTVKRKPSPNAYLALFQALSQNGKYDEAATTLEEMIAKYPETKNPNVLFEIGRSRLQAGRNDAALKAALDALKIDANDFNALTLQGLALGRLGKNDEAIALYKGMLEKFPNVDAVARVAHSGLSTIYVNMEDFDKGEAELELLLEKDADDPGTNNDLGYLYADRGKNLEKAEEMIRKAVEEEPENGSYLDSLGWVLFKRNKLKEAVEPLEKASKASTTDATIFDHLGDVYFRLQDYAKAKASWKQGEKLAASSVPPDKRLPEIRKKLESLNKLAPAPRPSSGDNP